MSAQDRRSFIKESATGVAGATAALALGSVSRAAGANERLRVGRIGCGGRGRYVVGVFSARDDIEIAYVADPHPHNCDSGAEFYGTKGQMFLSRRGKIQVLLDRNQQQPVDVPLVPQDTDDHVADFIDAIRNGRKSNADIEIDHITTSLCHLGNIANRLGRSLRFDPDQEQFVDELEADKLLARAYQDGHWARPKVGNMSDFSHA